MIAQHFFDNLDSTYKKVWNSSEHIDHKTAFIVAALLLIADEVESVWIEAKG